MHDQNDSVELGGKLKTKDILLPAVVLLGYLIFMVRFVARQALPNNMDSYRDIGSVNNLLGGNYFGDPSYYGESIWYNPLSYFIQLLIIKGTGLNEITTYFYTGLVVSILAIVFFFLLAKKLAGAKAGILTTLVCFFIFPALDPSGHSPSFTYLGMPLHYGFLLFLVSLYAYSGYLSTINYRNGLISGGLSGLLFLTHAAPFLLFTTIILLHVFFNYIQGKASLGKSILIVCTILLTAFVVAFPLIYFVFFYYKFKILNHAPSSFWPGYFSNPWKMVENNLYVLPIAYLFIVSRFWVLRDFFHHRFFFILSLLSAPILFLLLTYGRKVMNHYFHFNGLAFVPVFHFYFYIKFAMGIALAYILSNYPAWIHRLYIGANLVCLAIFPLYIHREDFREYKFSYLDEPDLYTFLVKSTSVTDVLLTDARYDVYPVMLSGRKTIAAPDFFSNQYVDLEARKKHKTRLMEDFYANRVPNQLSKQYHLRYVLVEYDPSKTRHLSYPIVFTNNRSVLYRIVD